jgi:tyrosinase
VQCLSKKPAKTPSSIAAGAKNRYDDFVAIHINSTLSIHGTGNFLTWHRYFTWAYEQVLRNECGYKGYQPYYQWAYWANEPDKSPAMDGSDTSMSGDGEYVPGRSNVCIPSPDQCGISLPPGSGGGCIKSGPFRDWRVHLGPVAAVLPNLPQNPEVSGLGYNPRCLKRDISRMASSGWTKDQDIVDLVQKSPGFLSFSTTMQGDFGNGFLGVHTGGHFTIGGDTGGDLFASPGDPMFFLHHAMIDRTYWTWQNLDLANRQYALAGTITVNNVPPSRDAVLQDPIDLGYVGVPVETIESTANTLGGPFCYVYA